MRHVCEVAESAAGMSSKSVYQLYKLVDVKKNSFDKQNRQDLIEVFKMHKGSTQMVIKAYYLQSIPMLNVLRVRDTSIRDSKKFFLEVNQISASVSVSAPNVDKLALSAEIRFGRKQSYHIRCTFGFGGLHLVNSVVAESRSQSLSCLGQSAPDAGSN